MLAGIAAANPACTATGLDQYILNNSTLATACQVGDILFYGFSYSGSALAPADTLVSVDVVSGSSTSNPGLSFGSFGFLAYGGQTLDATITYSVATVSGANLLDDYSLDIAGAYFAGKGSPTTGIGSVTESITNPVVTSLVDAIVPGGVNSVSGHVVFDPPVSGTTVTTSIHMELPAGDKGYLTISGIDESFSERLPEPGAVVLIGSGLCFLGLRRKARKTLA